MPGKHKGGKKPKDKILGLMLLGLLICSCEGYGYLPHKGDSKEFRVLASSSDFSDFKYHGQLIGGNLLHDDIKIGGLLEMDKKSSNMRGLLEYSANKYVKIGVTAGVSNEGSGLGDFMLTVDIPLYAVDILPFAKITHNALSTVGLVVYFTLDKVLFNVGASYRPHITGHQKQLISVMVGTGFK